MRKRDAIRKMVRDVEENDVDYTILRGGEPVAVIVSHAKLAEMRAELCEK